MEDVLLGVARFVALVIDVMAVAIVGYGAVEAFIRLVGVGLAPSVSHGTRTAIWQRFGVWLLLGLEFELAADIIGTVVSPTWRDIGELRAIAATPAGTRTGVSLDFVDPVETAAYYAADSARFASASFETMLAAESGLQDDFGVAWSVVQLYYAAFYAEHAALRILGCSCSYLQGAIASRLTRVLGAIGAASGTALTGGLYGCTLSGSDVTLCALGGGSGGSHALFWKRFVEELDTVVKTILSGPLPTVDAQDATARLMDVRSTLASGSAHADWLTRLHNEVQYRHGHGLWYPNRLSPQERRQLVSVFKAWTAEEPRHLYPPAAAAGDLSEFASACVFLTALCRGLVLDIAQRTSRRGQSFVDYGPAKLLRQSGR